MSKYLPVAMMVHVTRAKQQIAIKVITIFFFGNPATAVGIPKVPIVTHFYEELFSKFSISPLYLV